MEDSVLEEVMGLLQKQCKKAYIKGLGYQDENAFWVAKAGVNKGKAMDTMTYYLSTLGYTGTPTDQLRKFLQVKTGKDGTMADLAKAYTGN